MKYKCPKCGNTFEGQPSSCPYCGAKLYFQDQTNNNEQKNNLNQSSNTVETTNIKQQDEKPYEKYIDKCKNYIVLSLIASIVAALAAIFTICIPFVNDDSGNTYPLIYIFFQYIKLLFDLNYDSLFAYLFLVDAIYFVFIMVSIVTLLICSIIDIVKNSMRLNKKADYAMEFYFVITRGKDEGGSFSRKSAGNVVWGTSPTATNMTWSVLISFALLFAFDRFFGIKSFNSINGWISLVIILLLVMAGLNIASRVVRNSIRKEIIQEEYK